MKNHQYEKWKVVGDGIELVQVLFESDWITVRTQPFSGYMLRPESGSEEPITMPREHADCLAFLLKHSNVEGFRNAKVVKA